MITNFYLTFNYSMFYKISFAKLAYFHSASWPSFVRQVGRVLFGKLAEIELWFQTSNWHNINAIIALKSILSDSRQHHFE